MGEKLTGFVRRFKGTYIYQQLVIGGKMLATTVFSTIASGAANVCEITFSVSDMDGNPIDGTFLVDVWLSDSAEGLGLTATTASGAVTVKAGTGTELSALTASKALRVATKSDGTFVLSITDTAKTGFYVATSIPTLNVAEVSRVLTAGDYG